VIPDANVICEDWKETKTVIIRIDSRKQIADE